MNLVLQEYLALLCVFTVAGVALWRRWTNNRAKGCTDCSVAKCRPSEGGMRVGSSGVKPDPYRPQLQRPVD